MKAIYFTATVPRYLFGVAVGRFYRPIYWSGLSCIHYGQVREPALPNAQWVKIKVHYAGICGSDVNLVQLRDSPYMEPFSSSPFVMGHEGTGTIIELGSEVTGWTAGERVIVDPLLSCVPRGISDPCPACRRGDYNLCENFTRGDIAPGLAIGGCRDTGGTWGPYFVAHKSQLLRIPESVSDENALLTDAFGCALHAVLRNYPSDKDNVLVIGAGVIGLCTVIALRALGSKAHITVLAKYPFQAEQAMQYGSDRVICLGKDSDYHAQVAAAHGAQLYRPMIGKPVLVGGADIVFECVGEGASIDDALRMATSGGRVVLVGLAALPKGVDWTPIWFHELQIKGSFWVGSERYDGRQMRIYEIALDMMAKGKINLAPLLTHKFALSQYREAFRTLTHKNASQVLKAAFLFE